LNGELSGIETRKVQNTPKTINRGQTTTFSGAPAEQGAAENAPDSPKTIHGAEGTISCSSSEPGKRGRGAPPGNLNALKTGRWTAATKARRKEIWEFTSQVESFVRSIEALYGFRIRRYRCSKKVSPVMPDKLRRIYREKARK
jgi:hypothetical protein